MNESKIISIANQKGGVAKTTTACNLAYQFSKLGKKTLIIDLDQQGTATTKSHIDKNEIFTINQYLIDRYQSGELFIDEVIHKTKKGYHLIGNNSNSKSIEFQLIKEIQDINEINYLMLDLIEEIKREYDIIIFDCPPNLDWATNQALQNSDEIICPIQPSDESLEGLTEISSHISKLTNVKLSLLLVNTSHNEVVYKTVRKWIEEAIENNSFETSTRIFKEFINKCNIASFNLRKSRYNKKLISELNYVASHKYNLITKEILKEA